MRDNLQALAQQPGMGWIDQLQQQAGGNEVHWQQVVQASERSSYSRDGFGPAGALVITAIVGVATAGIGNAAGAAVGDAVAVGAGEGVSLAGGGTFLGATGAGISGTVGAVVQMGVSTLANQAALSFISNDGNLSAVFDELGSSASVRNLVTSMVTAGVVQGLGQFTGMSGWTTANNASWQQVLTHNVTDRTAAALVSTALNGGDLGRNLGNAIANGLLDTAASTSANWIGSNTTGLANAVAHAVAGCVVGAGRAGAGGGTGGGSGCGAGAVGAVVGELVGQQLGASLSPADTVRLSSMLSGIAGALVGGDAASAYIGLAAGQNAVEHNLYGLLARAAPAIQRGAQVGLEALSAAEQAAVSGCLASPVCRNGITYVLPAAAVAWLAGTQTQAAAPTPTGAAAIPTGYAALPAGTTSQTPGYGAGGTIAQPDNTGGNQIVNQHPGDYSTGGDQIADPRPGGNVVGGGYGAGGVPDYSGPLVTPNNGPISGAVVMNINGAQQPVQIPSIIDADRAVHILTGDSTGGGHLWPGEPGKTPFPQGWDANAVLGVVSDIATDPNSTVTPGGGGRTVVTGVRDGVEVSVILERPNHPSYPGRVVTAYPTNLPRNPK